MQITNWNKYYANGKINIMLITTNIGDNVKYVLMAENVKYIYIYMRPSEFARTKEYIQNLQAIDEGHTVPSWS